MSNAHRWFIALGAALAFAAPLSAQQDARGEAGPVPASSKLLVTPSALSFAPKVEFAALNPRTASVADTAAIVLLLPQARQSENVALMIVGGAAMVVGAVIGGDAGTIVMIGGGVAGLIGLFRYLR